MPIPLALALLTLQPPVGFVSHYPMVADGAEVYGDSGATVALIRAPWELIQPSATEWSPDIIDEQLLWAQEEDVRLIYVIEAGPAHCASWVRELVAEAGETLRGVDGAPHPDPSIFSSVYVEHLDAYIRRVVADIRDRDTEGRVMGYSNGCEWWYPSNVTFGELERAAFERAMAHRYGSVRAAREAWGLEPEGRVDRPPVFFDGTADPTRLATLIELRERVDASWCPPQEDAIEVEAGREYVFEADVRTRDATSGGALLQIAWVPPAGGPPVTVSNSPRVATGGEWQRVSVTAPLPGGADRAWLHLKSQVRGTAEFRDVSFCAADSEANLAPAIPDTTEAGPWIAIPWTAGDEAGLTQEHGDGFLRTTYDPPATEPVSPVWVNDWFDFMGDAVAEFIGHMADEIRVADPTCRIVTYLTFAFASPFNWDYCYEYNIHPQKVFAAREYDGLGMQLAAADGDYHHVTAGIDMVRHLGDPWLIDLQDFTAGVYIGSEAMTRTTLAGIAAGARGVVYYCWWGTPDYDFYQAWPEGELEGMIAESKALLDRLDGGCAQVDVALLHPMTPPYAGAGEPDPGRFMLLYKAVRRLGLGARIITDPRDAPAGMPLLTVDDVPGDLPIDLLRSTEKGNTPPMFKFLGPDASVQALAEQLSERLGVPLPGGAETFHWIGKAGGPEPVELP
jgi:hypothetical protein